MNYIVISPFYPDNFQAFTHALVQKGVKVFGIGQEPYEQLGADLQASLIEYFRVNNLEDLDEVKRAVAFFFYKYGPIDRIESHNEYWLEQDAELREQFNVFGVKPEDLVKTKFKSEMKKCFKAAGVPVVEGAVLRKKAELPDLIAQLGLPLIAKPDNGVGAAGTFKLADDSSIQAFTEAWDEQDAYFLECFVDQAEVCSYDGMVDKDGNVVFDISLTYCESPFQIFQNANLDMGYFAEREIDPVLRDYGRSIIKTFGMRERFFHIEFFRRADGSYVALEYNNRPAGGFTIDVYNHAHRFSLFEQYASMVAGETIQKPDFSQFSLVVARHKGNRYQHSDEDISRVYGAQLIEKRQVVGAFADLLGDVNYFFVSDNRQEIIDIANFVRKTSW